MIRTLVKLSQARIPKISSSYFNLRNKSHDLFKLNVASASSSQQNKYICSDSAGNNLLRLSTFNLFKGYVRFKSKDKKSKIREDDSDDEESNDNENEYDEDGNKMRTIKVKSMRADNLLGKCMGLTRRKIEDLFLESKFRHNDQPLSKKSLELKPGDTLEICSEPVDTGGSTEVISKLNILKITSSEETTTYYLTFSIEKK